MSVRSGFFAPDNHDFDVENQLARVRAPLDQMVGRNPESQPLCDAVRVFSQLEEAVNTVIQSHQKASNMGPG